MTLNLNTDLDATERDVIRALKNYEAQARRIAALAYPTKQEREQRLFALRLLQRAVHYEARELQSLREDGWVTF